ncbi:MAG: hypothetical protein HC774_00755 [Sphingomonadales bacterium]|nr:hypothetical protein [Sphingomonadales bacterium]
MGAGLGGYEHRDSDDEADAELLRILDRQKAMLPKSIDVTPAISVPGVAKNVEVDLFS